MPYHLQQPIKKENEWEIDVPGDNSCLFWAAACAYLVPVINNQAVFQTRCLTLFGDESSDKVDLIKNFFSTYNPFSALKLFENPTLNILIREQFRSRVIEYIATHKEEFAEFWATENVQLENSFDDYLSRMHAPQAWGGNLEIRAISQLLDCTIHVQTPHSPIQTYSSTNGPTITLIHANTANEGESRPGNHYHFTVEESIGDAYQASAPLIPSPTISMPLSAAPSIEQQKVAQKKASFNTAYKVEQDKVVDLKILFKLSSRLDDFLKKGDKPDTISPEAIQQLMTEIAQDFSTLKWKNNSEQHIRNLYGKTNYKKGEENKEYIDFERLSLSHHFADPVAQHSMAEISHQHIGLFLADITLLFNNLLAVLYKELSPTPENPRLYLHKECPEIWQYVESRASSLPSTLSPLNYLLPLFDIHYDPIFLRKMCLPTFVPTLANIDKTQDANRWRYTFARIFTIIGEAANNLSDSFKNRYSYLPIKELVKLRDQLAHNHHQHIAQNNVATLPFLLSVEADLAPLQQLLNSILAVLPETIDPSVALETIKRYSASIDELLPIELQDMVSQPFPLNQSTTFALDVLNLLRAARIAFIENIQKSVNPHIQIDQSEAEYQTTINQLISTTKLKSKQQRQLTSVRKKLAEIGNRKLAEGLGDELTQLRLLPSFHSLLDHFKNKAPDHAHQQTKNPPSPLNSQVHSLLEEIKQLNSLHTAHLPSERNYASEHSIAVIGQLSKDLTESKTQLLKQIFQENGTIQQAFSQNASARNQKVMHDPFNDHTPYLSTLILNETLPLAPDIEALNKILRAKTQLDIQSHTLFMIIKTYTEIGNAYFRLNLLKKAKEYLQLALSYTKPNHFATFYMQEVGLTLPENTTAEAVSHIGDSYHVMQGNYHIVSVNDSVWTNNRVYALVKLANCEIKQDDPAEAIPHLKEALEIYSSHIGHNAKLLHYIEADLYVAMLMNGSQPTDLLSNITKLRQIDYDIYVYCLLHYIHSQSIAKKYEESLEHFEKIDHKKIVDKTLYIQYYFSYGLLLNDHARMYEEWGAARGGVATDDKGVILSLRSRENAISKFKVAHTEFTARRAQLKFSEGIHINDFEKIIINLARAIGTLATKYLEYSEHQNKAYQLIHEALRLQIESKQDTSTSYITLASLCEEMYEKTPDETYLVEGLNAYAENTQHSDIGIRATAYAGKASILFKLERAHEAIKNSIEGLFYYSQVAENKRNAADKEDIAYLNVKIEQTIQTSRGVYKQVLNEYAEAGEEYQANNNPIKAIACYKKCLLALKYMTDVPLQQKVEAKLQIYESSLHSTSASTAVAPVSYLPPPQLTSVTPIGSMASL